ARGEGATARQGTMTHNTFFELVRLAASPSAAGDTRVVLSTIPGRGVARRQLVRPSFGPEGRIFYPEVRAASPAGAPGGAARGGTSLVSVKSDGSDKQDHLSFP